MEKERKQLIFAEYRRKSTEDEGSQVQSLDDQANWIKQKSKQMAIKPTKVFEESKSAKKPYNRPEFTRLVAEIQSGNINAIICWNLDRLSRNPIDSAQIQWLLQQGQLKSIVTASREYLPSDNTILFSVDSGMANEYIRMLSKNTIRGIDSKANKGWSPFMAPIGYLNDKVNEKGEKKIFVDKERWNLVRKIFDLMLTGNYNPHQILAIVTEDGLRTRKTKKQGGGPVTKSGIYRILTNIYYTGNFYFRGEFQVGKHKQMITMQEFDHVQILLGSKGRPRPQKREFAYTGLIYCGECGCQITAESKGRWVKQNSQFNEYIYYRCTRKKRDVKCTQKPMRVEPLEEQIVEQLSKITIHPEFRDWALKVLNEENKREYKERGQNHTALSKKVLGLERELYDLNKTYTRGKLDDEFYEVEKKELKHLIDRTKAELAGSRTMTDKRITISENVFKFASNALEVFASGDIRTKREIFHALGGKFTLTDHRLEMELAEWFQLIADTYPALEEKLKEARTRKYGSLSLETAAISQIFQIWGE